MQIVIYSTVACPFCKMQKDYFDEKRIVYSEKLIDQDELAQKEMINISNGFLGVPFTSITKDDGSCETVIGFDKGKLDKIIPIIQ